MSQKTGSGFLTALALMLVLSHPLDALALSASISTPSSGATVSGTTNIEVSGVGGESSQRVQFYIDGNYVGEASREPYIWTWDTTTEAEGSHSIRAVYLAYMSFPGGDESVEQTITVTVENTFPPVSSVPSPPSDPPAAPPSDTPPPSDPPAPPPSNTPTPLSASISAPSSGATVSGTTNIEVSGVGGESSQRVQFYIDGNYVGEATSEPFIWTWNTTAEAEGPHSIRAVYLAYMSFPGGDESVEQTVTVTVENTSPPVSSVPSPPSDPPTPPPSDTSPPSDPPVPLFAVAVDPGYCDRTYSIPRNEDPKARDEVNNVFDLDLDGGLEELWQGVTGMLDELSYTFVKDGAECLGYPVPLGGNFGVQNHKTLVDVNGDGAPEHFVYWKAATPEVVANRRIHYVDHLNRVIGSTPDGTGDWLSFAAGDVDGNPGAEIVMIGRTLSSAVAGYDTGGPMFNQVRIYAPATGLLQSYDLGHTGETWHRKFELVQLDGDAPLEIVVYQIPFYVASQSPYWQGGWVKVIDAQEGTLFRYDLNLPPYHFDRWARDKDRAGVHYEGTTLIYWLEMRDLGSQQRYCSTWVYDHNISWRPLGTSIAPCEFPREEEVEPEEVQSTTSSVLY